MRTSRLLAAALAVTTLLGGGPVAAQAGDDEDGRSLPRRIGLPQGWQPEGITTDGRALYVGSLANGALWKGDPHTGRGRVLAQGRQGRVAVGIDHDHRRDLVWVAGGPTGMIRAHDADTGRVKAYYQFGEGRFVNDLTVTPRGVFATDSMSAELLVVPLPRHRHHLPPQRRARTLAITGDFELVPEEFNLNGIEHDGRWLLAVQSVNGHLFRIDPREGESRRVDVPGARLVNGDGLERKGEVLYVVRNFDNRVVSLDLNERLTRARRLAALSHPSLDVPTAAAATRKALWAVNARFGTEPTADTRYWITRLPLVRAGDDR